MNAAFVDTKLSEVASLTGVTAHADKDLPVYSVTKHRGFVPSLEYFKKQVFSRELGGYTIVEPGEFAYATIHLDEGSIGICPERCLISPMYTVFRTDEGKIYGPYLLRFLKSPKAMAQYPALGKGSAERRRAISFGRLGQLKIPLLALAEQKRIAKVLELVEGLRSRRRTAIVQLDFLTQSLFVDLFGDPSTNSKGWASTNLKAVLSIPLRNGLSPSKSGKVEAKVLTLSAITGAGFDETAWKTSTFMSRPPTNQSVNSSDFLICRGNGNLKLVGKGFFPIAAMPEMTFPDTMIAARISVDKIERAFFQHVWNSPSVRTQITSLARTTNGTYKVNQPSLECVQFVLPPLNFQQEFARRVNAVEKLKKTQQTALAGLDALFTSLQHRAFQGGV